MKPVPQFLPPRQTVVYAYTRRMLDETAVNANQFAMAVAEQYVSTVAPDVRQVKLRLGEGDDLIRALKNNGQILRRYMDGTLKVLPSDLEDAWVMALPEPYRSDCERDLALRRQMLAVRMPSQDALSVASMSKLFEEYGHLMQALAPALADGKFGPEDKPHVPRIKSEGRDLIAAVLALEHDLDAKVYGEGEA